MLTVDGQYPKQPPGMVLKPCQYNGIFTISTGTGFLPSTVGFLISDGHSFDLEMPNTNEEKQQYNSSTNHKRCTFLNLIHVL